MVLMLFPKKTNLCMYQGHPNREDLKDMYSWVKPKSVIPVHGEHRHMFEHINFAKEMQVPYPVGSRKWRYSSIISRRKP